MSTQTITESNQYCAQSNAVAPKFEEYQSNLTANLIFIVYILFTLGCAIFYSVQNRKKFKDKVCTRTTFECSIYLYSIDCHFKKDTLATKFNAGGNMSISMLSSTIVSQWTWAASLLQSTSVGTNVKKREQILIFLRIFKIKLSNLSTV